MAQIQGVYRHSQAPKGYNLLAELMGLRPQTAIFRQFRSLNALNILSLQAELGDLADQYRQVSGRNDCSQDPIEQMFSKRFQSLLLSAGQPNEAQLQTLLKIRAKLKEYNAALLQAAQVSRIPQPSRSELTFLRGWLQGTTEGGDFLQDIELSTWKLRPSAPEYEKLALDGDFVSLKATSPEDDALSRFISGQALDIYHYLWGSRRASKKPNSVSDRYGGAVYYNDTTLIRINSILISVLSSALPVLSIVALYFIRTTLQRIGAVVAFTVVFSFALATCTNARRLEIFASTAAFAAVEVVFIGTVLSGSDGD